MPIGGTISDFGGQFEDFIRGTNQARQEIAAMRDDLARTTTEANKNTNAISALIAALTDGMDKLGIEVGRVADNMSRFSSASAQGRRAVQEDAKTTASLYDIYKSLNVELKELTGAQNALESSTKELAKVEQLYNEYLRAQEGSYDKLSAKYRIIKILYDNMSTAELSRNPEIATSLREIYENMNMLQQATGKYQLQVGNYSKALTGLNIATNQVVRELPVLANGVSMFAIAISNNIPIFADQVVAVNRAAKAQKALKDEYLAAAEAAKVAGDMTEYNRKMADANAVKVVSVGKALASTIFSWQTALVLVLTVLPGLIKKIQQKTKAQEDDNAATKDAIEYETLLANAYNERDKEQVKSVSKLQVLYNISQDVNRSMDDRIKAAKIMKDEYKDELANLSETDILLGRAKSAYDKLTESLVLQAKARAYLNKITSLQEQMIDQQATADRRKAELDAAKAATARAEAEVERQAEINNSGAALAALSVKLTLAQQKEQKALSAWMSADSAIQDLDNAILALEKDIPVEGLMAELMNGPAGRTKDMKVADYYNDALASLAAGLKDSLEKRLAELDLAWKKEREKYEEYRENLLKVQKEGNEKERAAATAQMSNLQFLIISSEQNYINARKALIQDMLNTYKEEVQDEGDLDEQRRKVLATRLDVEKELRNAAYNQQYEMSQQAASDKLALDEQLRDSEEKYWRDYLALLREEGLLTVQVYNEIMAKLAKASGESGLSRGRRGRKYGGVVEAILAQTSKYGEGNKFGQGILKEEYTNFVTAVDSALKDSMKLMDEWMDKRLEMAQIAVKAAEKEVDAAKTMLEYELEARNQGYANNVDTARKELELARKKHKEALDEQRKMEEAQLAIDTAKQISSLVTATANIWAAMTAGTGILGPILAAAATTAMFGSFAASKIMASQLARKKSEQYGEGTVEMLEGGSHASGHDIDLGTKKDGTRRRAEGGEYFAIINKRNSRKYRGIIPDVINSFNDGTFGDKYQRANAIMGNFALSMLAGGGTDISNLEREVRLIREQGEENRFLDSRGNMVVRYKNLTRKYKM